MSGSTLSRMYEYDRAARDLIVREPFASIAEAVLGEDCHMMSQNWIRTTSDMYAKRLETSTSGGGWHTCVCNGRATRHRAAVPRLNCAVRRDDLIQFPLPEEIPAHQHPPPIFVLQIFVLLTDVLSVDNGPTVRTAPQPAL